MRKINHILTVAAFIVTVGLFVVGCTPLCPMVIQDVQISQSE